MPRGTYRTGVARNRRLPDPGGAPSPLPLYFGTDGALVSASTTSVVIEVSLYRQGTPVQVDDSQVRLTEIASTARITTQNGIESTVPEVSLDQSGVVTFTFNGTFPTGDGNFIGGGTDPSVRGTFGEWIGAPAVPFTISPP